MALCMEKAGNITVVQFMELMSYQAHSGASGLDDSYRADGLEGIRLMKLSVDISKGCQMLQSHQQQNGFIY